MNWVVGIGELRREIFKIKSGGYMNDKQMEELQSKESAENNKQGRNWKTKNVDKSIMEVLNLLFCY